MPTWEPWATCVPPHSSREKVADVDDADGVAVLLAEQGDCPGGLGLRPVGVPGPYVGVVEDVVAFSSLDGAELIGGESSELGGVEAQPVGFDQGALLAGA